MIFHNHITYLFIPIIPQQLDQVRLRNIFSGLYLHFILLYVREIIFLLSLMLSKLKTMPSQDSVSSLQNFPAAKMYLVAEMI